MAAQDRSPLGRLWGIIAQRDRVEPRSPIFGILPLVAMIAVVGSVIWYSYPRGGDVVDIAELPIVRADPEPFKTEPTDRGGMEIPYRESTIFETFQSSSERKAGATKIENLMPDPEKPMDKEELFAGLNTALEEEQPPVAIEKQEKPVPKKLPEIEKKVSELEAESEENEQAPAVKPVEKPTEKPTAKPVVKTETKTTPKLAAASGDYYIQLASIQDAAGGQKAFDSLVKQYPDLLSGLGHRVEKADLGAKGIYYRIQAGGVTQAKANEICSAIKAKKPGGCLVVGP